MILLLLLFFEMLVDVIVNSGQLFLGEGGDLVLEYNLLKRDKLHFGVVEHWKKAVVLVEGRLVGIDVALPRRFQLGVKRAPLLARHARIRLSTRKANSLPPTFCGEDGRDTDVTG